MNKTTQLLRFILHPPLLQLLVNSIDLLCKELVVLLLTGCCLKHGLLNLCGILGMINQRAYTWSCNIVLIATQSRSQTACSVEGESGDETNSYCTLTQYDVTEFLGTSPYSPSSQNLIRIKPWYVWVAVCGTSSCHQSAIRPVGDHLLLGSGGRISPTNQAKLDSTDTNGTCLSKQRGSTKKGGTWWLAARW